MFAVAARAFWRTATTPIVAGIVKTGSAAMFSKPTRQVWPRYLRAAPVQDTNGRLEGGWRHTAAFEFGGEIDRAHILCLLALAVGPRPAAATGQHHIREVNWILPGRRKHRGCVLGRCTVGTKRRDHRPVQR
jgi:hypothetical protein